jgi:hypothetical protein
LPRRVSVPGADELFRRTVVPRQPHAGDTADSAGSAGGPTTPGASDGPSETAQPTAAPSGRVRHDEKMTVYVTADELLALEHARLSLRRAGLSVDRGRLVREAVAIALADLDVNGEESLLVHRLTQP